MAYDQEVYIRCVEMIDVQVRLSRDWILQGYFSLAFIERVLTSHLGFTEVATFEGARSVSGPPERIVQA